MLRPINKMVYLFYHVNATILIDKDQDLYLRFKEHFDRHYDGEYVYSPSVDDALNRINNDFKEKMITIFSTQDTAE